MAFERKDGIKISYECSDLIAELKQDIAEFGEDTMIYVWVKDCDGGIALFTNYDFIVDEMPITADELKTMKDRGEHIEVMTMGILMPILVQQNEIV